MEGAAEDFQKIKFFDENLSFFNKKSKFLMKFILFSIKNQKILIIFVIYSHHGFSPLHRGGGLHYDLVAP